MSAASVNLFIYQWGYTNVGLSVCLVVLGQTICLIGDGETGVHQWVH